MPVKTYTPDEIRKEVNEWEAVVNSVDSTVGLALYLKQACGIIRALLKEITRLREDAL